MKILALKLLLLNFFSNSPGGPTSMDGGGQTQRTPKSGPQADEMDLDDEELKPGEIPDQPLGLLAGEPKYSPAAAGPFHSLIDSDDDLYNDLNSSNKPLFLQHHDPSCIPSSSPQISGTDLSVDSPSSTTSPLLPLNHPLNYTYPTPCPAAPPININQPPDISLNSSPRNSTLAHSCKLVS
ncbi:hypothetical protein BDR04DRAFT_1158627 [Suillus decipiens]|nr:hypothetical protein BDR04DRAFT_1158627 [Suillus decipiens]